MFLFNRLQQQQEPYRKVLRCYSVAFNTETHININDVNSGGKIFLPQSALEYLLQQRISYPMHFMIRSPRTGLFTHCGVLEFTAPEGRCYMPLWMMERIGVMDEDTVEVAYTVLPRGTGVTLQACTSDFLDISDHRAVLEVMMTRYAALTVGDIFVFHYNKKDYRLEVRDVLPHNRQNAINIVETNLAIEFERPKDMPPEDSSSKMSESPVGGGTGADGEGKKGKKKKKKKSQKRRREEDEEEHLNVGGDLLLPVDDLTEHSPKSILSEGGDGEGFVAFSGVGHSLSSDPSSKPSSSVTHTSTLHHADSGAEFVPFSGEAHTLSGRSSSRGSYSMSSNGRGSLTSSGSFMGSSSSPAHSSSQNLYGRSALTTSASTQRSSPQRFVAFQGEGHRLG